MDNIRTFHQYSMDNRLKQLYEKQRKAFWLPTDPDLTRDKTDLDNMPEPMSKFAKYLSAFFAVSDNLVNISLSDRIINFVEKYIPEKYKYVIYLNFHFQVAIEDIHSEQYSLFLENYCDSYVDTTKSDISEKDYYINCINNFNAIKEKANFILKIVDKDENNEYKISNPIELAVYCMCVERINFSASFAGAFYFKSLGLLPGFTNANELISRDEGMHCEVLGVLVDILRNESIYSIDDITIQNIVRESCEIEKRFADEALPENIPNMNSSLMKEYVEYIGDHMLSSLNVGKIYNTKNPFSFMENISLEVKTSFFEQRVTNYTRSNTDSNFDIDADV